MSSSKEKINRHSGYENQEGPTTRVFLSIHIFKSEGT